MLNACRLARGKFSVAVWAETITRDNYIYPYHQAVGFYLERAGVYDEDCLSSFRSEPMNYNFYLTHRMGTTAYSPRWRLFHPAGLR